MHLSPSPGWTPHGPRCAPTATTYRGPDALRALLTAPRQLTRDEAAAIVGTLEAPPCCAAALLDDLLQPCDVDFVQARYTRTAGRPHPRLAPDLDTTPFPPCRFDCPLAVAVAGDGPLPLGQLLWIGEGQWVRLGRDGALLAGSLSEELRAALSVFSGPVALGGLCLTDGTVSVDLCPWTVRAFVYAPETALGSRALTVLVVDHQRWEVDFSGAQELQFSAADLARVGHRVTLLRVVVGLSGEALGAAERAALTDMAAASDLYCTRVHVSDTMTASLAEQGTTRLFLISTLYGRRPPADRYDIVVDGGRRHELVATADRLARGVAGLPPMVDQPVAFPYGSRQLYWPATHAIDLQAGVHRPLPRQLLVTARGCPYRARVDEVDVFAGVSFPASVNRAGCTYCPLGGDYRKPPVDNYLGFLVDQIAWYAARAPTSELLVADEASFSFLGGLIRRIQARGLRPGPLLFKARLNGVIPRMERFRSALEAAQQAQLQVSCYLLGIENFSEPELRRYNKGVSPAALLDGLRTLLALEDEFQGTFSFSHHNSHGFILFNPWTALSDLSANLRAFRAIDIHRLSGKATWSRLRLHPWQPLHALAVRDGLLDPDGARFRMVVPRQLGYHPDETPWRFRSPAVELVYWLTTHPVDDGPAQWASDKVSRFAAALAAVQADPPEAPLSQAALAERLQALVAAHTPAPSVSPVVPGFSQVLRALHARFRRQRGRALPWTLDAVAPHARGWRLAFQHAAAERELVALVSGGRILAVEGLRTRSDRAFLMAFEQMLGAHGAADS